MEFKSYGKLSIIWTAEFCDALECPPYDEQFGGYPHRSFENGAIFRTRQLPSEDIEEVTTQAAQVQAQEQTTGSGTKGKGKGKANYDKWTNEEQSFLVDLWLKNTTVSKVRTQGKYGKKSATRLKWTSAPKRQSKMPAQDQVSDWQI